MSFFSHLFNVTSTSPTFFAGVGFATSPKKHPSLIPTCSTSPRLHQHSLRWIRDLAQKLNGPRHCPGVILEVQPLPSFDALVVLDSSDDRHGLSSLDALFTSISSVLRCHSSSSTSTVLLSAFLMRSNTLEFTVRTDRLNPNAQSLQLSGFPSKLVILKCLTSKHRLVDKPGGPPAPPWKRCSSSSKGCNQPLELFG